MKLKRKPSLKQEIMLVAFVFLTILGHSQTTDTPPIPVKVHHIEPLFIDLVRDLGARKGEKELNLGGNFANTKTYSQYDVLAEYEFAPINRLGLEFEVGFLFFDGYGDNKNSPKNKMEALKLSAQYSFYVSPKHKTTLAIGYAQIFELTDFGSYDSSLFVKEIVYSPFFIAAKGWGENFHTLIFTGPLLKHELRTDFTHVDWQLNTSFHYEIPNTSHFIGIEFNKEWVHGEFEMTMRPQAKLQINHALALGIVTGFPLTKSEVKFSSFFRMIYEL